MREIRWTDAAVKDMASLDRTVAKRVQLAVVRLATSGEGDVKRLVDVHPPEFRLRVGDWRIRFQIAGDQVVVIRVLNRREAYR